MRSPHRAVCAFFIAALFLMLGGVEPSQAQERDVPENGVQMQLSFAPVVKNTAPAVVNIYTKKVVERRFQLFDDPFLQQFFGANGFPAQKRVESSLGSGVIVDGRKGLIVTNNHVVDGAQDIKIVLSDRRELSAKIVHQDKKVDLAVLRLETPPTSLPSVPLSDGSSLQVGDLVLAIGNPFGIGQTVTHGIVSALARTGIGINDSGFFIQTDAAINPGNSGGALVNLRGELVGIPTAIYSKSGGSNGIGFATPAALVSRAVQAAETGKAPQRPWLGAVLRDINQDDANAFGIAIPRGVLVEQLVEQSPLALAGVTTGSLITALNNETLTDAGSLRFRLTLLPLGESVTLEWLLPDGKERRETIRLISAPDTPPQQRTQLMGNHPLQGALVANLNPALREELAIPALQLSTGVIVLELGNGNAARLGVQPGDKIVAINGVPVDSVGTLEKLLRKESARWQITLQRGSQTLNLVVR